MSELEFQKIINELLGIVILSMEDSIFDNKYGLTEIDAVYAIYILISKSVIYKNKLISLLELDDITFEAIYKMCY